METNNFKGKDEMLNVPLGLTAQVKLGKRVALNADFTMINNISQHYTFDGRNNSIYGNVIEDRGFNGTLYNATIGLSIYLGKKENHADWYFEDKSKETSDLENRLAQLEEKIKDSDNDGVADYLDEEPNTPSGNLVDTKGKTLDSNKNGIPDSYESYINNLVNKNEPVVSSANEGVSFEDMINNGYINVYFPFNSATPTTSSYDAINFMTDYLKANPSKSVELIGTADVIGNDSYNVNLSNKRSNAVKDLLTKAGVDSSRMSVNGKGEDDKFGESSIGRALVRRVTFKLK
ncbi:OmpA family protein [Flavobacterium sp.]